MKLVDINVIISFAVIGAAVLNFVQIFRAQRVIRWHRDVRMILWAYEKELLERGVMLPPRCAYCCQILPQHVDGCILFEDPSNDIIERLTRPPIKYYRDGSRPPSLEGK